MAVAVGAAYDHAGVAVATVLRPGASCAATSRQVSQSLLIELDDGLRDGGVQLHLVTGPRARAGHPASTGPLGEDGDLGTHPHPIEGTVRAIAGQKGSPMLNPADEVLAPADSVSPSPAADIDGAPTSRSRRSGLVTAPRSRRRPGTCPSPAPGRRVRSTARTCAGGGRRGRFAVVRNCIEGRAQRPLLDCVRARYDADVVTEPEIDAVLALGDAATRGALLDKVCVSRLAHLAYLVVAGHHDCAANAVPRPVHEEHLRTAVHRLRATQPRLEVAGVCSSTRGGRRVRSRIHTD